jgi:hypothetical protein
MPHFKFSYCSFLFFVLYALGGLNLIVLPSRVFPFFYLEDNCGLVLKHLSYHQGSFPLVFCGELSYGWIKYESPQYIELLVNVDV